MLSKLLILATTQRENQFYFAVMGWCQTDYRDWLMYLGHQNTITTSQVNLSMSLALCAIFFMYTWEFTTVNLPWAVSPRSSLADAFKFYGVSLSLSLTIADFDILTCILKNEFILFFCYSKVVLWLLSTLLNIVYNK